MITKILDATSAADKVSLCARNLANLTLLGWLIGGGNGRRGRGPLVDAGQVLQSYVDPEPMWIQNFQKGALFGLSHPCMHFSKNHTHSIWQL